jgi:hypothetical protein
MEYVTYRHPESWYHALAAKHGHPGYVTLSEIIQAEQAEPAL